MYVIFLYTSIIPGLMLIFSSTIKTSIFNYLRDLIYGFNLILHDVNYKFTCQTIAYGEP